MNKKQKKTSETTGHLIGNKTADGVAKSNAATQPNDNDKIKGTSRTVHCQTEYAEFEKYIEILRERHITRKNTANF